ncbi:putative transposase [Pseudarthrobacter sp. S6]|uniref:putative transposase n=1 Tax=Pseudarthrobacter sp. S6 TaxID=3418420 RepID=UPI003CEAABB1
MAAVLYVDGHVRAYQGGKKIGKVHSTRLKFPVPATEETWVSDAHGSPVLVVMAKPGTALTGQLRALLPQLRTIIGDSRRVLVGFDGSSRFPGNGLLR